jgi:hypothetical protein
VAPAPKEKVMSESPRGTSISNEQYSLLANRRQTFDALLWQTPVLSLTAQAFLFTIALSAGNKPFARFIAATLALIVALASLQLMAKHRYHEESCSKLLQFYEGKNHLHPVHSSRMSDSDPRYIRWSSYVIWIGALWAFVIAATLVLLSLALQREWL